jgi:ankyrin repeat protein
MYQWLTALQLGTAWGDKEFITVLLAHGADPNIRGEKVFQFRQGGTRTTVPGPYGTGTVLNVASMYGHVEIVKLLLGSGANVNIQGKKVFQFRQGGT